MACGDGSQRGDRRTRGRGGGAGPAQLHAERHGRRDGRQPDAVHHVHGGAPDREAHRDPGAGDDRLVDEELLLQRGFELGLVRRDAKVRNDVVAAVIDTAVGVCTCPLKSAFAT